MYYIILARNSFYIRNVSYSQYYLNLCLLFIFVLRTWFCNINTMFFIVIFAMFWRNKCLVATVIIVCDAEVIILIIISRRSSSSNNNNNNNILKFASI